MPKHSTPKRSEHELKGLIEEAVTEECGLTARGLWLCVDKVEVIGRPPDGHRLYIISGKYLGKSEGDDDE
jgi:hypothetical protein